jgi:hypothetical protein
MKDREERGPLLEEDVDHLVRDQTRRGLEGDDAPWSIGRLRTACAEECVRVDIGR